MELRHYDLPMHVEVEKPLYMERISRFQLRYDITSLRKEELIIWIIFR